MKKLVILFICLAIVSTTFATGTTKTEEKTSESASLTTKVSGKVIDKTTGETLAGVKIRLNNSENAVYTDFEGNFEINGVRPGTTEIIATYISYKETKETITISLEKTNTHDVKIENIIE